MANTAPVISSWTVASPLRAMQWSQLLPSQIGYSDADSNPAVTYEFWDGGGAASSAYFYKPARAHHAANTTITVSAANLNAGNVWIQGGTAAGSEQFFVRAFDGLDWSNWAQVTVTTLANAAPVVNVTNGSVNVNGWLPASALVSYSDADSHPAVTYEFWDSGTGASSGYIYTPGNAHHAANTSVVVAGADLANVWFRGGSATGTEAMHVRAFDGLVWSNWQQFNLGTVANTAPTVTVANHALFTNEWAQLRPWMTVSDPNAFDTITQYQFFDNSLVPGSSYLASNSSAHHTDGTAITIAPADLDSVFVRAGTAAGNQTIQVRAFDGTDWGDWDTFTLNIQANALPAVTHATLNLPITFAHQVSTTLGYSDANSHAAVAYEFYDGATAANSAYFFSPGTARHAAGVTFGVSAAELSTLSIRAGSVGGTDQMFVRAFDGIDWGNWLTFNVNSINNPPIASIDNQTIFIDQWRQLSTVLGYADPAGTPAVRYEFWDTGTVATSSYLYSSRSEHHPAGAGNSFILEAAELNSVWLRGGSVAATESMQVRAFDGENWSAWDSFTVTTVQNAGPQATVSNFSIARDSWIRMNTQLIYVDSEGHSAVSFEIYDGGVGATSGYFYSSSNEHHAADTSIIIPASEFASMWVRGGSVTGSETMYVRAFDGLNWGPWDQFTLTTV
jgi:hypothetical protein